MNSITVIGAGLAGSEAALQLAHLGIPVVLYEMKPGSWTPAHHSPHFAELVCSNSLRAARVENAVGLLKYELRRLGSFLLAAADRHAVPAGGALAVDREEFSRAVTQQILQHPLVEVRHEKWEHLPKEGIRILATGPLTQGKLFEDLATFFGEDHLHFFDAAAPIVAAESLDRSIVFAQSRYGRGGEDYLNCPMTKEEYLAFYEALLSAERADVEDFDKEIVFEGCMPIETMASRGEDTMRFGPLKPVGLIDPRTGKRPYACVQLRQDDRQAGMYNLVGFQTRLRQAEQRRVFSMIPGLQNISILRYGVMHRNTFLHSPGHLWPTYAVRQDPTLFIAGQMTGVEGYVESIASGFVAGINAALLYRGEEELRFDPATIIGSMAAYISDAQVKHFQPMNANFGLVAPFEEKVKRHHRAYAYVERAARLLEPDAKRIDQLRNEKNFPLDCPSIPLPDPYAAKKKRTRLEDRFLTAEEGNSLPDQKECQDEEK